MVLYDYDPLSPQFMVLYDYDPLSPQFMVLYDYDPLSPQVMVLYDYDPAKCSPSDNPEFELSLKEGNLVKVFGEEMSDGFLVGEVRGHCVL